MLTAAAPTAGATRTGTMQALVHDRYGPPEVAELREVPKPVVENDSVLVRVKAASINPADWYALTGWIYAGRLMTGGLRKPKEPALGTDFAGVVEAVGADVSGFASGDRVFGGRTGALADYVSVKNAVALMPPGVSFEEAAAVPIAGVTALQALRDKGDLQPGQRVIVNGASGGVGTFTVQIAKALGAHVTAVCSTRNVELVRSLGADEVVDYTCQDCTRADRPYDLLIDVAGSRSLRQWKRALTPEAAVVVVGANKGGRLVGPLRHVARTWLAGRLGRRKVAFFIAQLNRPDLEFLAELMAAGKLKPVVERTYELAHAADAFRHLGLGHCQGKLVVTV